MSETRERIRRRVYAEPGIHFNQLARELDIATGQTQYHLRRLTGTGELVGESFHGRTHYYPSAFEPEDREAVALLRRESCRGIVLAALEGESPHPAAIADGLGLARSTVEYHVRNLARCGLVEKRHDAEGVHLTVPDPEWTASLLGEVEPTVADRLVDRFTSLLDELLEE